MDLIQHKKFPSVYEADTFEEEFLSLVNEAKTDKEPYPRFQKWLITKLEKLAMLKENAIILEEFEDLHETEIIDDEEYHFYSIRQKSKINQRIIYTIYKGEIIILLCSFKEQKGVQEYRRAIKRAKDMIKRISKEDE